MTEYTDAELAAELGDVSEADLLPQHIRAVRAAAARLRARSEDTERLDFLQSQPVRVDHFDDGRCCVDTPDFQTYSGDSVRAAIDSARKRGE